MLTVTAAMTFGLLMSVVSQAQALKEAAVTLKVGDAPPALTPGKWIKGEPVAKFEKDKIYVVEFWATWCPPCRESIPHLSKLQEEYKDVTFIGQDCREEGQDEVPAFVAKMGDQMNYRVALDDVKDDKQGVMFTSWMMASGQRGIPTAFIIDKESHIAWIGHPMELDGVLKDVVAGTFDPKKAAALKNEQEALQNKFMKAMQSRDFDGAIAVLDELTKAMPAATDRVSLMKFNILLQKKDYPTAWELGKKLSETFKDKAEILNGLAWTIVDPEQKVEKPNLDLAKSLALRAVEVSKGEDGGVLDTLARVYSARGEIDKAIETQAKAVEKAAEPEKDLLRKSLEQYKAAKAKPAATPEK